MENRLKFNKFKNDFFADPKSMPKSCHFLVVDPLSFGSFDWANAERMCPDDIQWMLLNFHSPSAANRTSAKVSVWIWEFF